MQTLFTTFLLVLVLFVSYQSYAQVTENEPEPLRPLFKLELGFRGIGLAYEVPLAPRWSIDFSTGLGGGYRVGTRGSNDSYNYVWVINDPVMYFESEIKYTYNRPKRLRKGKPIRNNGGHYVAFQTKYTTERVLNDNPLDQAIEPLNNTLLNEIHWGLQQPLGQRFLFNFSLGLGYAVDYDFDNATVYPGVGLKFSWILAR